MMKHLNEKELGFPRLCAHRGYNFAAPENTLPAFAMAVAMGAEEIELDLWPTKDGDLVVCHDPDVSRTTGGSGRVTDMTTKEVLSLDAGSWFSPAFKDTRIPLFEEVLDLLAGKCIINVHIKSPVIPYDKPEKMRQRSRDWAHHHSNHIPIFPPLPQGIEEVLPEVEHRPVTPYNEGDFRKLLDLLDAYKCREYAYIAGARDVLETARRMAPDIRLTCLEGHMNFSIVEHALAYGCQKVQFCKGLTTQTMLDKAKSHGLICNLFWADDPEEAKQYFDLGFDCILTNNYLPVSQALKK